MTTFYCIRFETPPKLESQVPVYISLRYRVAQLYPQALDSLSVAYYDYQEYGGGIPTRLHAGQPINNEFLIICKNPARTSRGNMFNE
jgi:hypothetical protein